MAVLFTSTPERGRFFKDRFATAFPDLPFHIGTTPNPADVEYLIGWTVPDNIAQVHPNLKVVFSVGAGVDQLNLPSIPGHIKIVRMLEPGIPKQMQEFVTLAVLALHRTIPAYLRQQRTSIWKAGHNVPASDRRIGIMGLGRLGLAALEALRPFDFQLAGWSRSEKTLPGISTYTNLEPFLKRTDILVCLLPLTCETTGILNAGLFQLLPKGAALVHAGRGRQLDQQALLHALDKEHLCEAWLDVTDPEPLPSTHPLWLHERVIITPHVACQTRADDGASHIINGIRAHRQASVIPGLIDRSKGY